MEKAGGQAHNKPIFAAIGFWRKEAGVEMTQKKTAIMVPLAIFVLSLVVLITVPFIYGNQYPLSVVSVFDDVVTFGKLSPLVGFMSDLGIALWFATAFLIFHGFHRLIQEEAALSRKDKCFYLSFGMVFLYLGLDDRLLIHEWLTRSGPVFEMILMAFYVLIAAGLIAHFKNYLISRALIGWLILSGIAFSLSIALDLQIMGLWLDEAMSPAGQEVMEESFKWIGICALFVYFFCLMVKPPRESGFSLQS